jgi:hypothetical protein
MTRQRQVSSWIVVILILLLPTRWTNAEGKDFSGRWETTYGIMTLEQVGESVFGHYIMKFDHCSIEGKVKDRRFKFKYREQNASGEGWFDLDSSGDRFSGMWREDRESTWRRWSGTRNPALTSPIPGLNIRFTSGKSAIAIPFEPDNNHVRLRVSVNGSPPLYFILDSGGSSPYPKLSLRHAESFGLKLRPLGIKNIGVGPDLPDVYLVTDTTSLSLPGVTLTSRWLFAISLDKANEGKSQSTNIGIDQDISSDQRVKEGTRGYLDGIMGKGFFNSFVVEIDYAARLINLYDPLSYKYTGRGKSFTLEMDSNYIYLRAQVKAAGRPPVTARLIVDTGSSVTLLLNQQFAEAYKLMPPIEKLTATTERGIGGAAEGTSFEGTLESLQLGDFNLSNPLTFFRHKPIGHGYDGLLGGSALRNFKVIFDFSRRRMILEAPR